MRCLITGHGGASADRCVSLGRLSRSGDFYAPVMRFPAPPAGTGPDGTGPDGPLPAGRRPRLRVTPFSVVSVALVLLLVLSQLVVTDHFFQRSSLSVLTPLIGILVIVAVGQAFVMGTGGGDLTRGATDALV